MPSGGKVSAVGVGDWREDFPLRRNQARMGIISRPHERQPVFNGAEDRVRLVLPGAAALLVPAVVRNREEHLCAGEDESAGYFGEDILEADVHAGVEGDVSAASGQPEEGVAPARSKVATHSDDIRKLVKGVMIESYIVEGNQKVGGENHVYGKSITDPCLGWEDSERLLYDIAERV